jgi:hypothetical protein
MVDSEAQDAHEPTREDLEELITALESIFRDLSPQLQAMTSEATELWAVTHRQRARIEELEAQLVSRRDSDAAQSDALSKFNGSNPISQNEVSDNIFSALHIAEIRHREFEERWTSAHAAVEDRLRSVERALNQLVAIKASEISFAQRPQRATDRTHQELRLAKLLQQLTEIDELSA